METVTDIVEIERRRHDILRGISDLDTMTPFYCERKKKRTSLIASIENMASTAPAAPSK